VQCHTVQGVGRAVGPELVGVRKRERAALLEDVLNPNAALAPPYINYVVATKSGSVLSGIIANESATSITLRRAEGAEDTLLREEIDEIHSTGKSLMPEGLEKDLSRQELADIIEYLKQIQ
jgi:putative heme-binding domain-containing protein